MSMTEGERADVSEPAQERTDLRISQGFLKLIWGVAYR